MDQRKDDTLKIDKGSCTYNVFLRSVGESSFCPSTPSFDLDLRERVGQNTLGNSQHAMYLVTDVAAKELTWLRDPLFP